MYNIVSFLRKTTWVSSLVPPHPAFPSLSLNLRSRSPLLTSLRRPALPQLLLNHTLQPLGLRSTSPPPLDLSIPPNQKLLKIPLDSLQTHNPWSTLLHPLVHGLDFVAVDFGFTQDGEGDAVVELAEGLDFVVAAGVLGAELVAGETNDFEVGVGGFDFCVDKDEVSGWVG